MNIVVRQINWIKRAFAQTLSSVWGHTSWFSSFGVIRESYAGAWQQNVVLAPTTTLLSFSAVYRCLTGISSDIAKMRVMLSENQDGIWTEVTENHPALHVLRNPNHYQDRIKFFESWMLSKLMYGNTYVLKQRDLRGVVNALHILHPNCVKPLIADNGDVYYELHRDALAQTDNVRSVTDLYDPVTVPAREIIHDRMATFWHPLVGVSPLTACALSVTMGNQIQNNSTNLFANMSRPNGVIEVPGEISTADAEIIKSKWNTGYSGANSGKTAVLADGMKFIPVELMTAEHAQLIEQLKWAVEDVGRAFGYPIWKLLGTSPPYTKPDQAQTLYYTDCLSPHIESIEVCLDNGLELKAPLGTEFEIETLMRMDQQALYESINAMGEWAKMDEQRFKGNFPKLPRGGDTVYRQQQYFSVEALAKRDALEDPFAKGQQAPTKSPADTVAADDTKDQQRGMNMAEIDISVRALLEQALDDEACEIIEA